VVLIQQTSSSGQKRRCDARCYNGKHARCRCICGGRNHGVGLEKALRNTCEMAQRMIESARAAGQQIRIPDEIMAALPGRGTQA